MITMLEVRAYLDPEEVDYVAAAQLGPEALPLLEELIHGADPMLASKAAYLTSMIPGDRQVEILGAAATSSDATVRVAAASGLGNLEEAAAGDLADNLLVDEDLGVRKLVLRSLTTFDSAAMTERVRRVAEADPEPVLRGLAAGSLDQT